MKPTITKEQADAIKVLRSTRDLTDEWILLEYADVHFGSSSDDTPEFQPIASMDLMTLAAALVNGYEVEKTPEEKVREFYESFNTGFGTFHSETHFRFEEYQRVIKSTLNFLGIKIEGVND